MVIFTLVVLLCSITILYQRELRLDQLLQVVSEESKSIRQLMPLNNPKPVHYGDYQGFESAKKILYYTKFYRSTDFKFGIGHECFNNCRMKNCFATNDRSMLDDISAFDAVIFHPFNFNWSNLDLPDQTQRLASQRYIMFQLECPALPSNRSAFKKLPSNYWRKELVTHLNSLI